MSFVIRELNFPAQSMLLEIEMIDGSPVITRKTDADGTVLLHIPLERIEVPHGSLIDAEALYRDLSAREAEVLQFLRSADASSEAFRYAKNELNTIGEIKHCITAAKVIIQKEEI